MPETATVEQPVAARDPVAAIQAWNADIPPADRQDKYARMAQSPFVFFRGSNHLFWADFAGDERLARFGSEDTRTWLKGDMHAENFGAFCNSEGKIVYDFNDFDDAIIADYQYDLWRMAVSLELVARQNGVNPKKKYHYVHALAQAYLQTLAEYSGKDKATRVQFTKANTCKILSRFLKKVQAKQGSEGMLDKWTELGSDGRHFLCNEKLDTLTSEERAAILAAMPDYGKTLAANLKYEPCHFEVLDIARRLQAGTGSLGTLRYYILLKGASDDSADHIILDVKQQGKPTPYHFLGADARAEYDQNFVNDGDRHAHAYRALTNIKNKRGRITFADDYLGWMDFLGGVYSVRRRSPYKKTLPTARLDRHKTLVEMAEQWGVILATAHSRAHYFEHQLLPTALAAPASKMIRRRKKAFQQLIAEVAFSYAGQVEADWALFRQELAPET